MGVPKTLTFAAGEAAKTITVEVVDDADYELDETVEVELRNPRPSGDVVIETGEAMAMVTIEDNDAPPALSIRGMSVAEGNAGTTSKLTFRVTKSGGNQHGGDGCLRGCRNGHGDLRHRLHRGHRRTL